MAALLSEQLDFIFFFYGMAFVLLGFTCWFATGKGASAAWKLLGAFGLVHGAGEWLDLSAMILGDSDSFGLFRMVWMTASFLLLLEFVRLQAIKLGVSVPGRWIHLVLALAIALVGIADGANSAGIAARYALGFPGAAGTAILLLCAARGRSGSAKRLTISAAAGFGLYAVTSGLIVPAGHFWPASIVNYPSFTAATAMPVQLVRGMIACWISFSIWGIWSEREATEIASARFAHYVHQQFVWTLAIMGAILVSGWTLTEYLGRIYRTNVEREAHSDIELLSSRLASETATVEAMAQSLAGAPSTIRLLDGGAATDRAVAQSVLDLDISAAGAARGYILDAEGAVAVSSHRRDLLPGARRFGASRDFKAALAGKPSSSFVFEATGDTHDFTVNYPVRALDGRIIGAAVLTRSLAPFDAALRQLDRPYFFIDPDGVVVMTNRPEHLYGTLWPLSAARKAALAGRFGALDAPPLLAHPIVDASWMTVNGERDYIRRRFVNRSDWSLVILQPPREIFATRFLGIVITLLVTIMALIYLVGRARRVHDQVQADNRLHLQELAADLGVKATTDALTGLHNRLKLEPALSDEMRRADRYNSPLTLILFDIDRFKDVNDTYGHLAGDKVLVTLARLVPDLIRSTDLLVRWGGEEFMILAPGADGPMGYQAAEKCCRAIAATAFPEVGQVTCSFGVAQYVPGESDSGFIARADAALYRAKAGGRNQVKLAAAQRIGKGGLASAA